MLKNDDTINKKMRKAIVDYQLINDATDIMVGLSGGKDSLTLLVALKEFLAHSKYKYRLAAGHIGMDDSQDYLLLKQFCADLDVPFYYEPTNITQVVFEIRKENNPCSLCAKMRRGALNNLAKQHGFGKVALGHHQDDVVETLLLSIFFEGRIDCFKPKTWLSNTEITVIRPFIYVPEAAIRQFAAKNQLPVIDSCCPANGKTKRQEFKDILALLEKSCPNGKERALRALNHLKNNAWYIGKE